MGRCFVLLITVGSNIWKLLIKRQHFVVGYMWFLSQLTMHLISLTNPDKREMNHSLLKE